MAGCGNCGDCVDLVPLAQGPTGNTGPQGPPGNNGSNGTDGIDGIAMIEINHEAYPTNQNAMFDLLSQVNLPNNIFDEVGDTIKVRAKYFLNGNKAWSKILLEDGVGGSVNIATLAPPLDLPLTNNYPGQSLEITVSRTGADILSFQVKVVDYPFINYTTELTLDSNLVLTQGAWGEAEVLNVGPFNFSSNSWTIKFQGKTNAGFPEEIKLGFYEVTKLDQQ